jgi:tol-pal system protein YbgF
MKMMVKKMAVIVMMASPMLSTPVMADEAALTQRVDRLERIIQGQGLVALLGRVDQQQNEIQKLYGENESLRHELESMKQRQRELYLDIDQRLQVQALAVKTPNMINAPQESQPALVNTNTAQTLTESVVQNIDSQQPETAPVAVENGEAAYQSALQILRSGQYEEAVTALAAFPEQYPQSTYLPNTYYWQGEANYVLRHFEKAIVAFQIVMDKYPASTKVADAMLKQGFSQYELGNNDQAKILLNNVMQQYSNTSAAKLAKVRLDRIKQETR